MTKVTVCTPSSPAPIASPCEWSCDGRVTSEWPPEQFLLSRA
jgi:hypothetical protein